MRQGSKFYHQRCEAKAAVVSSNLSTQIGNDSTLVPGVEVEVVSRLGPKLENSGMVTDQICGIKAPYLLPGTDD